MKWLNLDSPLIQFLNKMADLMWLNILTMICCISLFTAGASLTAAHYVSLKILRNEESYITRDFFHSFRINFKQSTLITLIILFVIAVLTGDYYILKSGEVSIPSFVQVMIMAIGILGVFTLIWIFPLQSRFANPIRRTLKNAFIVSILKLPRTLLMVLLYIAPSFILYLSPRVLPLYIVFGISVPVYVSAILYNKFFKTLEEKIAEVSEKGSEGKATAEDEDEKIFSDKPMDIDAENK